MFNRRNFLIKLALVLLFSFNCITANASPRLSQCTPFNPQSGGSSNTGLDGSNCDVGLVCDTTAKVCVNPTEVACVGSQVPCSLGNKCMTDAGQIATGNTPGICTPITGSSAENNALGDILCNTYKIATGKLGRGIAVIVAFVAGITFYTGKVQWGTMIAMLIGVGFTFGGPTLVSVLVGKGFIC